MGHAGAVISGGRDTAAAKFEAMRIAGIHVADSPSALGSTMIKALKASQPQHSRRCLRDSEPQRCTYLPVADRCRLRPCVFGGARPMAGVDILATAFNGANAAFIC